MSLSPTKLQSHRKPHPKLKTELKTGGSPLWWSLMRNFVLSNEVPSKDQVLGLIRGRNFPALLKLVKTVALQQYATASETYLANQLSALVKKYPMPSSEFDPEQKALDTFLSGEHACKRTNQRLLAAQKLGRLSHASIISDAQRYLRRCFGDTLPWSRIVEDVDYTKGANVGLTGHKVNWGRKLLAPRLTCSASAIPFLKDALWANQSFRTHFLKFGSVDSEGCQYYCADREAFDRQVDALIQVTNYNQIEFAPKTVETHRTIAKEPLGNGLVQHGFDGWMKECLRGMGIDLARQEPNQELARLGSLGGPDPFVTIDIKNASGTQATQAVKLLLAKCGPLFWALSSCRSKSYLLKGEVTPYHMFTSMGNGFCFPLETAIFASLCYACYKHVGLSPDFRVYGDDIIVRQSVALLVVEVLKYFGFTTNLDKTFLFGPFRESCGADWFEGQDIRPVYVHEPLTDIRELHSVHNSSLRNDATTRAWEETRVFLRTQVDDLHRFYRPDHTRLVARPRDMRFSATLGGADTAFHVPLDVFMSCRNARWIRAEQRWSWVEILTQPSPDVMGDVPESLQESLRYKARLRGSLSGDEFALRFRDKARAVSNAPRRSEPAQWCSLVGYQPRKRFNFQGPPRPVRALVRA